MIRKTLALVITGAISLLLAPGCSPKPGKSCDEKDKPVCFDKTTALECKGGTWQAAPCLGPSGCESDGANIACDVTLAKGGDICREKDEKRYSCTTDKKTQLRCKSGKWAIMAQCTGESGCDAKGIFANCSGSVSNDGDDCELPDDAKRKSYTCSVDKKSMLVCMAGKWKAVEQCLAQEGCNSLGLMVRCNGPTAKAGDVCDGGEKPDYACSTDGKAQLVCSPGANKWAMENACRGAKGCTSSILGIDCDSSIRELDEKCSKDGGAACAVDGKTVLECKDGKMQKLKACPTACKVEAYSITCD